MFPSLIINHIKRFTHRLMETSLCREFFGLNFGMFTNWYAFINLEAKHNFIWVKIEIAFCLLKQKMLYIPEIRSRAENMLAFFYSGLTCEKVQQMVRTILQEVYIEYETTIGISRLKI